MEYQDYTVVDFIMDENFFQWAWQPDESLDEFWTTWMTQHPHKRDEVEEARSLILSVKEFMHILNLGEVPPKVFKSEIKKHYQDLMYRIHNDEGGSSS